MYLLIIMLVLVRSSVCYFNIHSKERIIDEEIIQYDCLYYYVLDNIIVYTDLPAHAHQIIPYCIHLIDQNKSWNNSEIDGTPYKYIDLVQDNVTSNDLIRWSAPMDVVERFEMYLANNHTESLSSQVFYNCTWPLFGMFCQYVFESSYDSISDVVYNTFVGRSISGDYSVRVTNGTCYTQLPCYRGPPPSCLDWREVCDGKIDCMDGEDEVDCSPIEISECADSEYRCRNGQCIPEEFLWDDLLNPDCLDRTDLTYTRYPADCADDPSFRCEEHSCRHPDHFMCGDGTCSNYGSFCDNRRDLILLYEIASRNNNPHLQYECWEAIIFVTKMYDYLKRPFNFWNGFSKPMSVYASHVEKYCSPLFFFPMHPYMFGHVHFIYSNKRVDGNNIIWKPTYICYNRKLCDFLSPTIEINGSHCISFHSIGLANVHDDWQELNDELHNVFRTCVTTFKQENDTTILFQCPNSTKLISKHHLVDSYVDCAHGTDEFFNNSCSLNEKYRFACPFENKCFSPISIRDGKQDCINLGDEENWASGRTKKSFQFQLLCDGVDDGLIDLDNETDETHCEVWPCDNQYTHCNGAWNCLTGVDEIDCGSHLCSPNNHPCISLSTYTLTCLSLDRVNNGIEDCFGGTDERQLCRNFAPFRYTVRFRCSNVTADSKGMCTILDHLCNGFVECAFGDDEHFCENYDTENSGLVGICGEHYPRENRTDIQNYLCNLTEKVLLNYSYFSVHQSLRSNIQMNTPTDIYKQIVSDQQESRADSLSRHYCNRGLLVYEDKSKKRCLCPPAYYGPRCELQNQRVSLTLQFQKESSPTWKNIFHFFVFLIEENEHINSYEEIIYILPHDCKIKFNINLMYRRRSKDLSKNYSIHIDAFNKHDLTYHGSWYLKFQFPFLPVNRLSALLFIPNQRISVKSENCPLRCGFHGRCMNYVNQPANAFCQCDKDWSGAQCNVTHVCDCSLNSHCIGIFSNRSICLCPLHKYGPRCYISHNSCKIDPCYNGGFCVPTEERGFLCICPDGFSGLHCEYVNSRLNISFSNEISIPQSMLLHLITVSSNSNPSRITMFKKISFDETIVSLSIANPIDVVFIEFHMNYYVTTLQRTASTPFPSVLVQVTVDNRCMPIHKLLNNMILNYSLLHRIKYYHRPCLSDRNLKCIYDESYLCLCNEYHHANCFEFDHNMKYDCMGSSYCENGGQCFQDDPICAKSTQCHCIECFYGSKCQFSNKAFGLSLDGIIGYHIRPGITITKQPNTVKITIVLTVILFVAGLINGFLSILTFKAKEPRKMGCGNYLLASSINSLIEIALVTLKVLFLLISQLGLITNRNILMVSCVANDFLLKICINFGNWINACVSIERSLAVVKGITFHKSKSIQVSKWIITLVFVFIVGTILQDPISRSLIYDTEDQRIWCISTLSPVMQLFTSILNILHFFIPFVSNLASVLIIIIQSARKRSIAKSQLKFRQHLFEQLQHCKYVLISAFLLVILALPNLIISFISGCMKSSREPWLYLVSYFLSFIPSILLFPVFVLPSDTYRKVFMDEIKRIRLIINR